jgi:hypothetical protein
VAFQQLQGGGRGHRQDAVRRPNGSVAERDRPAVNLLDAQEMHPPDGPDDIEDCIDCPNLVQVDRVRIDAVDLSLGRGDRRERGVRALADLIRCATRGDEPPDLLDVPAVRLRRNVEVHLPARDVAAQHVLDPDADAIESHLRRQRHQPLGVEADIDERTQGHVTRDAAERIEDRDRHVRLVGCQVRSGTTRHCRY